MPNNPQHKGSSLPQLPSQAAFSQHPQTEPLASDAAGTGGRSLHSPFNQPIVQEILATANDYPVCPSCSGLGYHPPGTFDQNQDVAMPCSCGARMRAVFKVGLVPDLCILRLESQREPMLRLLDWLWDQRIFPVHLLYGSDRTYHGVFRARDAEKIKLYVEALAK